ncbi:MAG: tripartite tricarboxylate transporter substrate binding protein [Alphaproteobacteria bacterium]|nr:tripartite tricarboxylate transporter substrate binding protein [Alphaproteobacteria bacterium]
MLTRRTTLKALAALPAVAALPGAARAQGAGTYPDRPVRVVVPFAAGGVIDVVTRIVMEHVTATLGRPMIVDNRPGAGSTIGADFVAKSAPDGYTLLVNGLAQTAMPALYPNAPVNPERDFAPIVGLGSVPFVLGVHNSVPATDWASFAAFLRQRNGEATFATTGAGSASHLSGELMRKISGLDYTHVPYRATPAAITDLLAGRVNFMIDAQNLLAPHIRSGTLRGIAITTARRSSLLPEVPTFQEVGLAGYESSSPQVLYGPRGTPRPVVDKLAAAVNAALDDAGVKQRFAERGLERFPAMTPEQLVQWLRSEIEKWGPIIRATGATSG